MAKRELQIPINNILEYNSKEELVFRSPSTIPDKGIRNLIATKKILGSNCSYYDISPTENQAIKKGIVPKNPPLTIFPGGNPFDNISSEIGEFIDRPNTDTESILSNFSIKMGEINE